MAGVAHVALLGTVLLAPCSGHATGCVLDLPGGAAQPLYSCAGGLCIGLTPDQVNCPDGTVSQLQACAADHYNDSPLRDSFGTLSFADQHGSDGAAQVSLFWQSQKNGIYDAVLSLVTPAGTNAAIKLAGACVKATSIAYRDYTAGLAHSARKSRTPAVNLEDYEVSVDQTPSTYVVRIAPAGPGVGGGMRYLIDRKTFAIAEKTPIK